MPDIANLKSLLEERKKTLLDMQQVNDRTDFGPTDQDQWEKLDKRYQELDAQIAQIQRSERLRAEMSKPLLDAYAKAPAVGSARNDFHATDEYRSMFIRALGTGSMAEIRGTINGNSNQTTTAPVPIDMQRRIVELLQKQLVLRSLATVYTVGSDQQVTIDASTPTGYLVDESTTARDSYASPTNSVTESSITFARKTVGDFAYAVRLPVTKFAMQDYVGGGDFLSRKVGEGVFLAEEQYLMTGDGSAAASGNPAQPTGVVTAIAAVAGQKAAGTGSGAANAGLTTLAAGDIIETVHKILPRYRTNLNWLVGDTVAKTFRKFQDGNNRYLWQVSDNVAEGLTNGMAGTLYGVPVRISEFMPTGTGTDAVAAVCGNFSYCEIYDRGPLEFLVDTTSQMQKLMTVLQAWKRSDVIVTNTNAFGWLAFK